jgi:hypothetical protein
MVSAAVARTTLTDTPTQAALGAGVAQLPQLGRRYALAARQ